MLLGDPCWQALEYWEGEGPDEGEGRQITCLGVPLRRLAPSECFLPRAVHDYWQPVGLAPAMAQALHQTHRALFFAMIGVL